MSAGNEISVTVNNGTAVDVAVAGATGDALYVTNGATATVSVTSVGDRGPKGDPGPSTNISIGTVTTGAAGSTASASITGVSPSQTLNLVIPRGDTGSTGSQGPVGPAGPASSLAIGTVTTGAAGSSASVTNSGSSSAAVLNFTLPRGDTGTAGTNGTNGTNGREVQLQTSATHVQWRYVGDTAWTNLVSLASITGPQGPAGPATIAIGTVTTGAAGSSATVTNSGTSSNMVLDFTLPRGETGSAGVSWQPVPASPSASGTNGDIAYDASFLYVRSASGWRRTAIASWTPLGAPTSVSATGGNAQATVSWTAPVDNGGYAITDYAVQFSSNGGTTWTTFADGTSTATTATVTGLTNGTAYVFRVAAVNAVGTGPYSSATSSVTPGAGDPNFASVSLLLHMDGSNGSTTFTDSSASPKTVTANGGAAISTAESKFGGASGYFDGGTGGWLAVPNNGMFDFAGGDFTIEFWCRPTGGVFFLLGLGDASTRPGSAISFYNGGTWDFYYDGSSALSLTPPSLVLNQWQHIAVVRNAGTIAIYADGVIASSGTIGTGVINSVAGALKIGRYAFSGFTGYLDEFRVTKGVARYAANFTPPTAPFPDA